MSQYVRKSTKNEVFKRFSHLVRRKKLTPYIFLIPWILSLILLWFGPITYTIILSFMRYGLIYGGRFIGIRNYINIFHDRFFWLGLKNTFIFMGMFIPANMILGLATALLINKKIRLIGLVRTLIYVPAIIPVVAVLVLGKFIFYPNGLVNTVIEFLGFKGLLWLANPKWIKPAAVILMLWQCGTAMIIFLAGLQSVPSVYYEVAAIDGIGPIRKLLNITIPLLSPTIFLRLITDIIFSLMIFVPGVILPKYMVEGGPSNASRFYALHLYDKAFHRLVLGEASSLAVIFMIISLALTYLVIRLSERYVYYEV